jgi:hypothetical protein
MVAPAAKMAMAPQASETRFGDFKPIVGSTGATIYALQAGANHTKSMALLSEAGLRPFKEKEIILLLMKDEVLKTELKNKWFYIDGVGSEKSGLFTLNEEGKLVKVDSLPRAARKKVSPENIVRAYPGQQPLSFLVDSDDYAAYYGRRFDLLAYFGPHVVAPVVVGVPADREAVAPKTSAQPNVPAHLLRRAKDQFVELRKHQKPETIDAIEEVLGSL